ncbi:MAG: phage recombination protein Bet [Spirochaetia bacterium]|nr:phage recombination protein Bet [Spirochaetia bacterium]MBR0318927.1 phage recombination protein Bet [Spirochaetia bacterium]
MSDDNREVARIEQETTAVAPVSEKTILDYLAAFGLAGTLTKQEQMQFVEVARAYSLNPFKKEIYCVPHVGQDGKRTLSIITGYETYLKRAEHTGLLDGWECTLESKGGDTVAVATIYRKDRTRPFKHEVYMSEYNTGRSLWKSKPKTMLKKVAIAQAFRMCFPDDMGGMPYTQDELPEEMTTIRDVTPPEPETKGDWVPQGEPEHEAPAPQQESKGVRIPGVASDLMANINKILPEIAEYKDFMDKEKLEEIRKELKMVDGQESANDWYSKAFWALVAAKKQKEALDKAGRFKWATPEQRAEYEKLEKEGRTTVGEPAPPLGFDDDSKELYEK